MDFHRSFQEAITAFTRPVSSLEEKKKIDEYNAQVDERNKEKDRAAKIAREECGLVALQDKIDIRKEGLCKLRRSKQSSLDVIETAKKTLFSKSLEDQHKIIDSIHSNQVHLDRLNGLIEENETEYRNLMREMEKLGTKFESDNRELLYLRDQHVNLVRCHSNCEYYASPLQRYEEFLNRIKTIVQELYKRTEAIATPEIKREFIVYLTELLSKLRETPQRVLYIHTGKDYTRDDEISLASTVFKLNLESLIENVDNSSTLKDINTSRMGMTIRDKFFEIVMYHCRELVQYMNHYGPRVVEVHNKFLFRKEDFYGGMDNGDNTEYLKDRITSPLKFVPFRGYFDDIPFKTTQTIVSMYAYCKYTKNDPCHRCNIGGGYNVGGYCDGYKLDRSTCIVTYDWY